MRFILSMIAVFAVGLSVLTACQNAAAPLKAENTNTSKNTSPNSAPKMDEHGHMDDAPRITLADAKKDFDAGTAVFVDTRAEVAYQQGHIKGAINIPMEAFEMRYKEIPTGKKIIAYCS
jgi:3-mercaptopyruvate sulfurtransferase SseA